MLFTVRYHAGCHIHLWGFNHWGFHILQPFGAYPWQAYVEPGNGHGPTPGMYRVAAPCTALSRGEFSATQSAVLQPFQLVGHIALGLGRESPDPYTFPAWWGGVFCSRFGSIQRHGQL